MKIVSFNRHPSLQDAIDAIDVIDRLRTDVIEGRVIAFLVAGLNDDDATIAYSSATKPVSRLRMTGAMSNTLHAFNQGEEI